MIISHKYKFVFIHIPKCAGKSVRRHIRKADPEAERRWGWGWDDRYQRFVDMAHRPLLDLPEDELQAVKDYRTCVIVRDPATRFASAVGQHFHQHGYRTPKTADEMLAELSSVTIRHDPAYIHFCPMHAYTHIGDTQLADTVLHLEDPGWQDGLNAFLAGQGAAAPETKVGHRNRRSETQGKPDAPTDMARLVALYGRDYALFGYEPPVSPGRTVDLQPETGWDRPADFGSYDRMRFLNMRLRRPKE